MKITASRLSEGNKVFPAEIHIEPNGLTVKIPGLFSGQSRHLDYLQIGEVSVNAPMVGFATITFYTAGTQVSAHGFTSSEVKQIKAAIEKGKSGGNVSNSNRETRKSGEEIIAEAQAEKIEYELEKQKKHDSAQKPWMHDSNFDDAESISKISFPDIAEDIEKTILRLIKTAVDKIKEILNQTYSEYQQSGVDNQKAMMKPYYEEINLAENCIEKATEGLKKLRRFEGTTINAMLADCSDSLDDLKNKWYPKLIEKRDKKKKALKITIIVVLSLLAALMLGLYIASKK